ncbi:MAG: hypothetical protein U0271_46895 [Polyangiaceae bacterium]
MIDRALPLPERPRRARRRGRSLAVLVRWVLSLALVASFAPIPRGVDRVLEDTVVLVAPMRPAATSAARAIRSLPARFDWGSAADLRWSVLPAASDLQRAATATRAAPQYLLLCVLRC